jgi:hypothetical protein
VRSLGYAFRMHRGTSALRQQPDSPTSLRHARSCQPGMSIARSIPSLWRGVAECPNVTVPASAGKTATIALLALVGGLAAGCGSVRGTDNPLLQEARPAKPSTPSAADTAREQGTLPNSSRPDASGK